MLPQLLPLELHHIRLLNMAKIGKMLSCITTRKKSQQKMSNLILVYSVMANEAIIKV